MRASPRVLADSYPERLLDRHLKDLRFAEVTRALRALSAGYVEKRDEGGLDRALEGRGKRAAFALYYGALHFAAVRTLVAQSGLAFDRGVAKDGAAVTLLDLGCGTGVCGAAWAALSAAPMRIHGVDRAGFVLQEAAWTYATLGLQGRTSRSVLSALEGPRPDAVVLGWALNEFDPAERLRVAEAVRAFVARGTRLLVMEPVSRRVTPWWDEWMARVSVVPLRVLEARLRVELHPKVALLARSAGLKADVLPLKVAFTTPNDGEESKRP